MTTTAMQQAIQTAHSWYANMSTEDVNLYLDELSAQGHSYDKARFTTDIPSRSITTKKYRMVVPTYVDVHEEVRALKNQRKELMVDYIHVVNELVFGDRKDVVMNERYEMLAKRLTDIQRELLTFQQYSSLDPDSEVAMIHPPQIMINANAKKNKKNNDGSQALKGGSAIPVGHIDEEALPASTASAAKIAPPQFVSLKRKVKSLLKSKFTEKI